MIYLNNIKNILFDLGGVILNIDFEKTSSAFINLGIKNFTDLQAQCLNNELFINFEKGLVSAAQFRNEIRKFAKISISDEQFDNAWNSMILDFPQENIVLLKKLRKSFKIFLLSNTNEIHYRCYNEILFKDHDISELSGLFLKCYFSHLAGLRKPDKEFFDLVMNDNNLDPSETLFIDDTKINTDAAKKLSINTYFLPPGETITDILT